MTAGDVLRSCSARADIGAGLAVREIARCRPTLTEKAYARGLRGVAFLLSSLQHPAEVQALREVYGPTFFVVSMYAHTTRRRSRLSATLAKSAVDIGVDSNLLADQLLTRDRGHPYPSDSLLAELLAPEWHVVLSVDDTFHEGDLFLDTNADEETIKRDIERFVALILSSPYETSRRDEVGMAHAYSSRLRSSSLSRQVGAAVTDREGGVITTGTNDVPKAGGGQYWPGDVGDDRDPIRGEDTSDVIRRRVFEDLLARLLSDLSWLAEAAGTAGLLPSKGDDSGANLDSANVFGDETAEAFVRRVFSGADPHIASAAALGIATVRSSEFFDVIEYGRALHAEMACICSAAFRGVPVAGATLYCTTFPCHECARLIVAAGITRVVYVEPYTKSRVAELYNDSIRLAHEGTDQPGDEPKKVVFEPFMGIAPRRHEDLFAWVPKKMEDIEKSVETTLSGRMADWTVATGEVRLSLEPGRDARVLEVRRRGRLEHEKRLIAEVEDALSKAEERYAPAIRESEAAKRWPSAAPLGALPSRTA